MIEKFFFQKQLIEKYNRTNKYSTNYIPKEILKNNELKIYQKPNRFKIYQTKKKFNQTIFYHDQKNN